MDYSPTEIQQLLLEAEYWVQLDADTFQSITTVGNGFYETKDVSKRSLAACHPDFPDAIRGLQEYYAFENPGTLGAFSSMVETTLEVLKHGVVEFDCIYGNKWAMLTISDMSDAMVSRGNQRVNGEAVTLEEVEINGKVMRVATNRMSRVAVVDERELETRYPGWSARWRLGQELGLSGEELNHHTFHSTHIAQPAPVPSNLTFE